MNVLDCTLRDGGYYNKWDFESEIVEAYLMAMAKANIDYVELGLRNFSKPGFFGAFAFTTETYLNSIELPSGPAYGVMVDAKTILESGFEIAEGVEALFVPESESKIDLVRVAAHFGEVEKAGIIAKKLKSMGYIVGLNLMQAGGKTNHELSLKAREVASCKAVDVLYFADSLGNMDSEEVKRIVRVIGGEWNGPMGVHTHNNMGKGLDNTMTSIDSGVTWIDATITGMGRGAGNTPTEQLLTILNKQACKYNVAPLYDIVVRHFEPMQKRYGWGVNLLYFLGAQNNIHPTYIQNLLSDSHFGTDEIIGAISYLSKLEGTESYSGEVFDTALNINQLALPVSGSGELLNLFSQREVLIVNNGPSLAKYISPIVSYIATRKPIVLAVNMIEQLAENYIDYYCVSHNTKFLSESTKYKDTSKPIILPKHRFTSEDLKLMPGANVEFGLSVESNSFEVNDTYCIVPFDLTIAYAIAIAVVGGCRQVSIVGIDGYKASDPRQLEMIKLIETIESSSYGVELTALTPTTYPVNKRSIYAPVV